MSELLAREHMNKCTKCKSAYMGLVNRQRDLKRAAGQAARGKDMSAAIDRIRQMRTAQSEWIEAHVAEEHAA